MVKKLHSPVRYYGGKAGMVNELMTLFPPEDSYDTFIEGFGGGGSLTLAVPRTNKMEIYNDLGQNIYSLYKVIADKEMFARLKEKLDITPYSEQLREEYKEALKNPKISIIERAFMYFYVNRTSFNGTGAFTMALIKRRNMAKSTSDYLSAIDSLPAIHERLSTVVISHKNIFEILRKFNTSNVFMYLDPPYVPDTRVAKNAYEVEMTAEEHEQMAKMLAETDAKILLSGYDNEIYRRILEPKFSRIESYSPLAHTGKMEIIWKNY